MTTDDCIKSIRNGLSLISSAPTQSIAQYNYGFSTGQMSMCISIGIIKTGDYMTLSEEAKESFDAWDNK